MRGLRSGQRVSATPPADAGTRTIRGRAEASREKFARKHWLSATLATACLGAAAYAFQLFSGQGAEMQAIWQEQALLAGQNEAIRMRNQQLLAEIDRLQTDEYIETVAREQLGYIRPGETPYMALDKNHR